MNAKKVKEIEPYTDEWNKEAYHLAMDFCPVIYPCKKCSHPVVSGYRCTFCGDTNPSSKED